MSAALMVRLYGSGHTLIQLFLMSLILPMLKTPIQKTSRKCMYSASTVFASVPEK